MRGRGPGLPCQCPIADLAFAPLAIVDRRARVPRGARVSRNDGVCRDVDEDVVTSLDGPF